MVWQLDRETFSHIVRDASAKRREAFMDFLKLGELHRPMIGLGLQYEWPFNRRFRLFDICLT